MVIRMRKCLPIALIVVAGAGVAGCSGVPRAAEQTFEQRYPGVEVASWEQQPYGWEAAFGGDDGAWEAEFDGSGRWLETEVEVVDAAGFPAAVRDAVAATPGGAWISKWEIEITPDGEFYEIETAASGGEYYFDATGRQVANRYEDA